MTISIDDISGMYKARDGHTEVSALRYKKLVDPQADYIAQVAHYPAYPGSELASGGYAGLTRVVAVNGTKTRTRLDDTNEPMNAGTEQNPAIRIEGADAVYLITQSDRTFDMGILEAFAGMDRYDLVDRLLHHTEAVLLKYADANGQFDYEAALAPHAAWQSAEWGAVRFTLKGDEEDKRADNAALIDAQKKNPHRINHAFLEQVYNQGRYALICCSGSSAPRLYGMWTGEWNPGWRGIYTLDANVNLQVAAMNTGHLTAAQPGYIAFFLRNTPDFALNAKMAYGMHDALQVSVNSDGDRGMHVEYDNDYPFQYWNAGASWCLLPIYEYWQCYGNRQIPITGTMRIGELMPFLGAEDGGVSKEAFERLLAKGELDLERDILLPLLTKQANFWEQICTPEYYTDADGRACHEPGKTALLPGERYMIIPGYSPENNPIGYTSTITANATMDIAAARDGLRMAIEIEKAVKREGYEAAVARWEALLEVLPDYIFDTDGALREWAMNEYTENNDHRHLSHLYPAWPAYETQEDRKLFAAARIAVENRDKYNTGDATAGHGWMHKALVYARLKNGDGLLASLLAMVNDDGYYPSLMSDHDTNRRNDTYCTDTSFGNLGAVHEALVFSNNGEIEVVPALPADWKSGSIFGLMARTRAEVKELTWDQEAGAVKVILRSGIHDNRIVVKSGVSWTSATVDGARAEAFENANGKYIQLSLAADADVEIVFSR
ncbi:hypothetical protein OMP38_12100 [Cohnella ginsengisoli]|uniref:Glycosyl hydrolase family 95 N-terminal domain-containing protein n=1 Tax=Cohnella ginsengisoli TaxID=425004 RepID=A0A9X4KHC3_9BACL|nr:hypothetical protein [Cohnella ginsengisoli]MDG0791529.1 hypothetical protein [Cohnella ginsengisoli]